VRSAARSSRCSSTPRGIKIRNPDLFPGVTDDDRPLAHQMFANWEAGAAAQAQHVRAYAGCPVTGELIVDPRYVWVIGKHTLIEWSQLGGKWAPSPTYGTEIEQLMQKLIA
jgi:N-acetylmuramoyl-L-alanine amidase